MCHDLGVPSVLNLNFCFVCLQLFSGCCDQSFHVFFDWEKKSPAAGSMSLSIFCDRPLVINPPLLGSSQACIHPVDAVHTQIQECFRSTSDGYV